MVRVWWPKFIRKPRIRLIKPSLKMPNKPSSTTVFILTLIFILVVYGGGVWDIVYRDTVRPMGTTAAGQPALIYPSLDRQFLIEGVVASLFIFIGFMGFIVMYQSTRHMYRPNYARLLLFSGMALVLVSYLLLNVMLNGKFSK